MFLNIERLDVSGDHTVGWCARTHICSFYELHIVETLRKLKTVFAFHVTGKMPTCDDADQLLTRKLHEQTVVCTPTHEHSNVDSRDKLLCASQVRDASAQVVVWVQHPGA